MVIAARYVVSREILLHTYSLHDVRDLGESLLCYLLLRSEQRGLVNMRLGYAFVNSWLHY